MLSDLNSSVLVTSALLEDLVSRPLPFLISNFVSVLCHASLWLAFLFSDLHVILAKPLLSTYYVLCPEDAKVREKARQENECNRVQGSTGKGGAWALSGVGWFTWRLGSILTEQAWPCLFTCRKLGGNLRPTESGSQLTCFQEMKSGVTGDL